MRRRHDPIDDEDEPGEGPDDDEEDEEPTGPARRRGPRRPVQRRQLRRWTDGSASDESDDEDEEEADAAEEPRRAWRAGPRERWPVYYRARDSVWFEPAVALAVIVVLLVSLWAYTQNWPPVYVVESSSMQHGTADQLGLINTGDLVLAQQTTADRVVPYFVGMQTGYTTYGEYGDVLLYHPDGLANVVPVIHRAIVYLDYNADGTFSIPELSGLPCGSAATAVYRVSGANACATSHVNGTLTLLGIGWQNVTVTVDLSSIGLHSGFLTMGDNNLVNGDPNRGVPDQPSISSLVEPGWIVGAARGMIPWFGAVKLLLSGQASEVPSQSWQAMGLALAGIILLGFAIHYVFRAEGVEDPRRRLEEEEAGTPDEGYADEDEEEEERRWRFWRRRRSEDDEEEEPEAPRPHRRAEHSSGHAAGARRGRPKPKVRRETRGRHRPLRGWERSGGKERP